MSGKGSKNRLRGKSLRAYQSSSYWEKLEEKKRKKEKKNDRN